MRPLLTLLTVALVATAAQAGDGAWPGWRGPGADGVAADGADPPLEWSESRNVRFKLAVPGTGLSSPVVHGDLLFLTTAVDAGPRPDPEAAEAAEASLPEWRRESGIPPSRVIEFTVLALDRHSGKTRWSRVVRRAAPHEGLHTDASWASATPATDGEVLIAHFGSHGTYALDLEGKLLWERDLGDMSTRRGFGEGSSPLLAGGRVIVNWDHEGPSFLTALDRDSGKTVWQVERDEVTSWSTPALMEAAGRKQVVVSATGSTRGYDLADGRALWAVPGMTVNSIPTPVVSGGRVYVASGYRGNMLQAIEPGADGAKEVWRYEQDTPYVPSPLVYRGRIWFLKQNKDILTCLDAASGASVHPRRRLEGIEGVYASPVAAAGRIYIAGRAGTVVVLQADGEYAVLATNRLDDRFDASPAIVGDTLYLRGREHLYALAVDGE